MVANDKNESEVLIQLEAAKSSLSSTISTLIEGMVEVGEDGKVNLNETELHAILRAFKKM